MPALARGRGREGGMRGWGGGRLAVTRVAVTLGGYMSVCSGGYTSGRGEGLRCLGVVGPHRS